MKYEVIIKQIERYYLVVDADSDNDAQEIAEALVEKNKAMYHDDSEYEISTAEIE